jgi:hypothetical protein
MIFPQSLFFSISKLAYLLHKKVQSKFVFITLFQSSVFLSNIDLFIIIQALFISISIFQKVFIVSFIIFFTSSSFATSHFIAVAFVEKFLMLSTIFRAFSFELQ